ncbi:MAG: peptide chain release factor 3 [Deltaproteobacteria bacterium CG11_big_fil_rev_8_21_14_0_20_42_23]|nr:MAG: peptide chain release factor 3 [Deltaproteobacteria bacterium CG11_big_fil_rev_8_21_14_0_20_42_23]PJC64061.1 MAG: peptide chain release factor 3 [Deltaproteobacteria bacterium CG_4_9_14_0_2_um_filter_42_21]
MASSEIQHEISRRRTFAIISHPDAGKTTITEKLLLFGNAIHMAGVVKAKRAKHFAKSDWMEIEKQRGISVASSVMQFTYKNYEINLLDTPGHEDFSEDTYRVLTAVDCALMVIDSAKGIETQTKKLFEVCRDRNLPIITFINKLDREGRDPFDLIDQIEKELNLPCFPFSWPIGQGMDFKGVYDIDKKQVRLFEAGAKTTQFETEVFTDIQDKNLNKKIDDHLLQKLKDDLELIEGAGAEFKKEHFLAGNVSPVFFGSALNNFGVQEMLESFINLAPQPLPRKAESRVVDPSEKNFTGLIFKIQANMDPKHRDRVAFMRICSGEFVQGMNIYHVRKERTFKLNNAIQFMSQDRKNVDTAYAGDIIGINDRGNLMIGDTITQGEKLQFTGIPFFSPEIFCRVELKNPIKVKQLHKGLEQLSEEGASQIFHRKHTSETIIGLVGTLQLEVVKFRLLNEYSADADFLPINANLSRWFHSKDKKKLDEFIQYHHAQVVYDRRDYPLVLLENEWRLHYLQDKNPDLSFYSSLIAYERDAL